MATLKYWDGTAWVPIIGSGLTSTAPTGSVMMFVGTTAPAGWLLCNGTNYPNTSYPDLAAVIGTTFGGTAGSSFTVPDFRTRFPVGAGTLAALGSTESGTNPGSVLDADRVTRMDHRHTHGSVALNTSGETTDHVHNVSFAGATNTQATGGAAGRVTVINNVSVTGSGVQNSNSGGRSAAHSHNVTGSTDSQGLPGGIAYHPYMGINFIIKT